MLATSGWIGAVAGTGLTAITFARGWQPPGLGSISLAIAVIGVVLIVAHRMLNVAVTIGRIYNLGFDDGYSIGRREGRHAARPVVVPLERYRPTGT